MATEYYRLEKQDGRARLYRVVEERHEVKIDNNIMQKFAAETIIKIENLMDAGFLTGSSGRNIGLSVGSKQWVFTIPIKALPLRVAFTMSGEFLVPNFAGGNSQNDMDIVWEPPMEGIRIYLLAVCPLYKTPYVSDQFLVAYDSAGRSYRLPTSNVYEDCRLCAGDLDTYSTTHLDALAKSWKQFVTARWQSDLSQRGGDNTMANSMLLFRFKPNDKKGFNAVPPDTDWTKLSTKISNEFINQNIILS